MIKALVIGCGKIAGNTDFAPESTHAGVYQQHPGIVLVAGVDSDPGRASDFAKRYGCEVFPELESVLQSQKPDLVSICTPDQTHYDLACKVISSEDAPLLLFVEKPVCQSREEFAYLAELAAEKGVEVVVNHSRRFDALHAQFKMRILAGEFGQLREVYATYYSGWKHNGVHLVDTLQYLTGDQISIDRLVGVKPCKYEHDATLELEGRFPASGARLKVFGQDEADYQLFDFEFRFSDARLRIEDFGDRVLLERKQVNQLGEHVLKLVDDETVNDALTPMQRAIGLIHDAVATNRGDLLEGYRLEDVWGTMNTIWNGIEISEKR